MTVTVSRGELALLERRTPSIAGGRRAQCVGFPTTQAGDILAPKRS